MFVFLLTFSRWTQEQNLLQEGGYTRSTPGNNYHILLLFISVLINNGNRMLIRQSKNPQTTWSLQQDQHCVKLILRRGLNQKVSPREFSRFLCWQFRNRTRIGREFIGRTVRFPQKLHLRTICKTERWSDEVLSICEMVRCRLLKRRQNICKCFSGWQKRRKLSNCAAWIKRI